MSELSAEEHPEKKTELAQLAIDVFFGQGWEAFANGGKVSHYPGALGEAA